MTASTLTAVEELKLSIAVLCAATCALAATLAPDQKSAAARILAGATDLLTKDLDPADADSLHTKAFVLQERQKYLTVFGLDVSEEGTRPA
jgi:hypothetical protein